MQVSFTLRKDKIDKQGFVPVRMLITYNGVRVRRVVKGVKVSLKTLERERSKNKNATKIGSV